MIQYDSGKTWKNLKTHDSNRGWTNSLRQDTWRVHTAWPRLSCSQAIDDIRLVAQPIPKTDVLPQCFEKTKKRFKLTNHWMHGVLVSFRSFEIAHQNTTRASGHCTCYITFHWRIETPPPRGRRHVTRRRHGEESDFSSRSLRHFSWYDISWYIHACGMCSKADTTENSLRCR